jgi:hypothetical protein
MIGDIGDSGDANLLVAGLPYIGRHPQIRLTIAGFEFALIEQNTAQQAPSEHLPTSIAPYRAWKPPMCSGPP